MKPEDDSADVWDRVFARLAERHVSPLVFGELTYPQLLAILTDGKSGDVDPADTARAVLADFKAGRLTF